MKWINNCPLPVGGEGDSLVVLVVLGFLILLYAEMKMGLMMEGSQPLATSLWKNSLVMEMSLLCRYFVQNIV